MPILASIAQDPAKYAPPRYEHDCSNCTYLGQYEEYDLYYCEQMGWPTVICRYGSDGPEYNSGMEIMHGFPALAVAAYRAIHLDLPLTIEALAKAKAATAE